MLVGKMWLYPDPTRTDAAAIREFNKRFTPMLARAWEVIHAADETAFRAELDRRLYEDTNKSTFVDVKMSDDIPSATASETFGVRSRSWTPGQDDYHDSEGDVILNDDKLWKFMATDRKGKPRPVKMMVGTMHRDIP